MEHTWVSENTLKLCDRSHGNTPSRASGRRYTLHKHIYNSKYTSNRSSDLVGTPLVMRVTPYTQYNCPLTVHVIRRYTLKSCEWSRRNIGSCASNLIDRITIQVK